MEFLLEHLKGSGFKLNVSVIFIYVCLYLFTSDLRQRNYYFPVPPFIRIRSQMILVRSQSTATLVCEVEAFPEPNVYWERGDGGRLQMSNKYRLEVYDRRDAYKVIYDNIS